MAGVVDAGGEPVVQTRGLEVAFGPSVVLRGIDLRIDSGQSVALLGPNGSGKSTLAKALVGLNPITAGQALLFGADITRRRTVAWERIGYVPQRVTAAAGVPATALEVVRTGLLTNRRWREPRNAKALAMEALDKVGLADRAHDPLQVFSGGQHQRTLIARALVRDPDFLLMDEPLAGIDSASKESLAQTLGDLRAQGKTLLLVLHATESLGALLDRAVVLRHGEIVHDGEPPRVDPGHDHSSHCHPDHPEDSAPPSDPHGAPVLKRFNW